MRLVRIFIASCGLLLVSTEAVAQTTIANDSSSLQPGMGYDTLLGTVRGPCVDVDRRGALPVSGENVRFTLRQISSERELNSYLHISAAAKYGGFVSGSASVTQESTFNQFTSYMLISIEVVARTESLFAPTLIAPKPNAGSANLMVHNSSRFREKCGDQFVSGRDLGGEYSAVVEIETTDSSDKNTMDAKISGGSGVFSGSAEGESRLQEITHNRNVKVTVVRGGGSGDIVTTTDDLIVAVRHFPSSIQNQPSDRLIPYNVTLQDYTALELPPGVSGATLDVDARRDFVEDADAFVVGLRARLADIRYVLNHPDQFQPFDRPSLENAVNPMENQITSIARKMRDCVKRGTCGAFTAPTFPSISIPGRIPGLTRQALEAQLTTANQKMQTTRDAFNNTFSDQHLLNACVSQQAQHGGQFGSAGICASGAQQLRDEFRNAGGVP